MSRKEYAHAYYLANKDAIKERNDRYREANRVRLNAARHARRKSHPESVRLEHERERRYRLAHPDLMKERGIRRALRGCTESEIQKAIAAWKIFDGVCQACHDICSKKFDTDHDHIFNRFRGIIGSKCNKTLGLVEDQPMRLRALATYLEESWATPRL